LAKDRFKTQHSNHWITWIVIGALVVAVVGLLATYALRPGRSAADDARTAAAIGKMDQAQDKADDRREEKRSATSLL
jgi:hypothetical protein